LKFEAGGAVADFQEGPLFGGPSFVLFHVKLPQQLPRAMLSV
jgi:hypothetical protein